MKFTFDERWNQAYIDLEKEGPVEYTVEKLMPVLIDYNADGEEVGIEILNVYNAFLEG